MSIYIVGGGTQACLRDFKHIAFLEIVRLLCVLVS